MPHVGTEYGQLLGVASNNHPSCEKAKITLIWEKLGWSKKWEVMLPGCYLIILIPRVIVHKQTETYHPFAHIGTHINLLLCQSLLIFLFNTNKVNFIKHLVMLLSDLVSHAWTQRWKRNYSGFVTGIQILDSHILLGMEQIRCCWCSLIIQKCLTCDLVLILLDF